ncbi:hypothetical protein BDV93DRAFT_556290 [Ceratobasidium sp. AG-I]|nr:hypothetical protein BDV93DRAFT_556290 [Ceratobasidium sp. AG-I]
MSAPLPPAPVPDPKIDATASAAALPQAQLENLRYKITQITESITGLIVTLNTQQGNGVAGGLAAWPELMTKYNVLLSKTHSLAASLGAAPTRKGQTSLKAIAPHPYVTDGPKPPVAPTAAPAVPGQAAATPVGGPGQPQPAPATAVPTLDPHLDVMLEVLLDGRRAPAVLRADIANSARLRLPQENGGMPGFGLGQGGMIGGGSSTGLAGGIFGGIREGVMTAEELRAEEARLDEVRRAHDARCARGVEAVRQLKDKYDWKSRLLFDDSDSEVDGALDSGSETPHEGDQDNNGRTIEEEDEDMVEVGVAAEEESPGIGIGGDIDTEEGTPMHTMFVPAAADSDSSSEDETPLNQPQARGAPISGVDTGVSMDINGDGMDAGDGSDSDGMEDIAPTFPPPIQPQYTNGAPNGSSQNQPQEQSPVSALENLWVIDP